MVKKGNINSSTTQEFLDVYDISSNFVILKNGTVSIVLTINSMNFGLLAEAEQDAIIYAYAALLNSLNYPIQILIQSKTKDATTYLNTLKKQEEKASSSNKKELIARYRQFVNELIKERNVLDKKFYVVVPATAIELGIMSAQSVLPGGKKFDITAVEKSILLEKAATTLEPKRDHLLAQFSRIGLYARQLKTQEIIQIFYNNYNPESYEGQAITDTNNYTTPLVQAQIIGGNMNFSQPTPNNNIDQAATTASGQTNPLPPTQPAVATPTPQSPASQTPTQQTPTPAVLNIQERVSGLNIPDTGEAVPLANQKAPVAPMAATAPTQPATSGVETTDQIASPIQTIIPTQTPTTTPTAPILQTAQTDKAPVVASAEKNILTPPTTQPTNEVEVVSADAVQNTIDQSLQDLDPTNKISNQNALETNDGEIKPNQTTKIDATQKIIIPPQLPLERSHLSSKPPANSATLAQPPTNSTKQVDENLPPLPEI